MFVLSFAVFLLTGISFAQNSASSKRAPFKLTVAVDKKSFYEEEIKESSYILPDNTIQLYPGETIYVEVVHENGVIKSLNVVKEIIDSSKTLTIQFTQTSDKKVHQLMMLKIENPFTYNLNYKSKIFLLRPMKWADTDVYPVQAKLAAFETWPDVITSIALNDLKFEIR